MRVAMLLVVFSAVGCSPKPEPAQSMLPGLTWYLTASEGTAYFLDGATNQRVAAPIERFEHGYCQVFESSNGLQLCFETDELGYSGILEVVSEEVPTTVVSIREDGVFSDAFLGFFECFGTTRCLTLRFRHGELDGRIQIPDAELGIARLEVSPGTTLDLIDFEVSDPSE